MRIRQVVNGVPLELEIEKRGDIVSYREFCGAAEASPAQEASIVEVEHGVYSVLLGTRSFDVRLEQTHYGVLAQHRSDRVLLEPHRSSRNSGAGSNSGPVQVKAAMPGKVVRVLVAEGDSVVAGQGLIVLEAMKMQNEISASRDGAIRRLSVAEGATVAAGTILCLVE